MRWWTGMRNLLLHALRSPDRAWLEERLQPVALHSGQELYDVRQPIRRVYFPLSCVIWLTRFLMNGKSAAVALVGNEGVVGLSGLLDGGDATVRAVVQVPGEALSMETHLIRQWALERSEFRETVLQYANAFTSELMQSAICNRHHGVRERYARALLQLQDRACGDLLPLTQELLATTLGVRRNAIGEVAADLQRDGAIRYHRGLLTITDRAALLSAACECYAEVSDGYERFSPHPAAMREMR